MEAGSREPGTGNRILGVEPRAGPQDPSPKPQDRKDYCSSPSAHRMPPLMCARNTGSLLQMSSRWPSDV